MPTYFFVIFEVHYTIFRYNVCLEKYMDLKPRLRSGTTLEDTEPIRMTKRSGSLKKEIIILSHTLQYSKIWNWLQPCFYRGFTYFLF